jgi:hypothetical protein
MPSPRWGLWLRAKMCVMVWVETPGFMPAPPKGALPRLDLGRLPIAGPLLIGRETELARLDAAWEDPSLHVLTFVAFGGMGKSALVSHWLGRMSADGWRGARRVLDWSFYSQGTEERVTSAAGAAERKGGHALRVIGTYAEWLGEGPELAALRLLGLFDRPAHPKAMAALRAKPELPGLNEPLMDLGDEAWQLALSNLREHGLLLPADPHQPGTLDAHPLVRVFFQEQLETKRPQAWQAGNLRLYEHLQKEAPDLPDTLEEMEPLFTAVVHGCRAGRQQEVYREVYRRRIQRGKNSSALRSSVPSARICRRFPASLIVPGTSPRPASPPRIRRSFSTRPGSACAPWAGWRRRFSRWRSAWRGSSPWTTGRTPPSPPATSAS